MCLCLHAFFCYLYGSVYIYSFLLFGEGKGLVWVMPGCAVVFFLHSGCCGIVIKVGRALERNVFWEKVWVWHWSCSFIEKVIAGSQGEEFWLHDKTPCSCGKPLEHFHILLGYWLNEWTTFMNGVLCHWLCTVFGSKSQRIIPAPHWIEKFTSFFL